MAFNPISLSEVSIDVGTCRLLVVMQDIFTLKCLISLPHYSAHLYRYHFITVHGVHSFVYIYLYNISFTGV